MAWWLQGDLQPFAHFRSGMGRSPGGSVGAAAAAAGRESRLEGGWAAPVSSPFAGTGLGAGNKARPMRNGRLVKGPQGGKKPLTKAFWRLIMRITKWVSRRKSAYPGKKEGVAP